MSQQIRIEKPCVIEYVALGDMSIALMAQRKLRPARVDALLASFNPDLLGVLAVNRVNGKYHAVDGQHRRAALIKWIGEGWEEQQVECAVYDGLSEQEEADLFLWLNNTLAITCIDDFRISLTAERKEAVEIAAVVQGVGLNVAGVGAPGGIYCVGTLYKVYRRGGHAVLRHALTIIRDAYGDAGLRAVVIDGIGMLVQRYNGAITNTRAVKALSNMRGGLNGLIGQAEELRRRTASSKAACLAAAAVTAINRTKGKNLPSWWKV